MIIIANIDKHYGTEIHNGCNPCELDIFLNRELCEKYKDQLIVGSKFDLALEYSDHSLAIGRPGEAQLKTPGKVYAIFKNCILLNIADWNYMLLNLKYERIIENVDGTKLIRKTKLKKLNEASNM